MTIRKLFLAPVTSRRHMRMMRGRLWRAARRVMSSDLADSVIRTWERRLPANLPY